MLPFFPSDICVAPPAELTNEVIANRHIIVLQGKACLPRSGRLRCDFQEGTVSFLPPSGTNSKLMQHKEPTDAMAVCFRARIFPFHTPCEITQYPFFDYKQNEALHLSAREKAVLDDAIRHIVDEMSRGYDRYSEMLVTEYLKLFLDYCRRFYDRQFITRGHLYDPIVAKVTKDLDNWIRSGCICLNNPKLVVAYFAKEHHLSEAYFDSMVKQKTGESTEQLILRRRFLLAKEQLADTDQPIDKIVSRLGFSSCRQLADLFETFEASTPEQYRSKMRGESENEPIG